MEETQRVPKRINPRQKKKKNKTDINQINEDQTKRASTKNSKGKATHNTQEEYRKDNS